jgi:hypothetical protein
MSAEQTARNRIRTQIRPFPRVVTYPTFWTEQPQTFQQIYQFSTAYLRFKHLSNCSAASQSMRPLSRKNQTKRLKLTRLMSPFRKSW